MVDEGLPQEIPFSDEISAMVRSYAAVYSESVRTLSAPDKRIESAKKNRYNAIVERTAHELLKADPDSRRGVLDSVKNSFLQAGNEGYTSPSFQQAFAIDTTLKALEVAENLTSKT